MEPLGIQEGWKTGLVLALEPNPLAYAWLLKSTKGVPNVVPLNVAAHSNNTVIKLWTVNNSMSSTVNMAVIGAYVLGMRKGHFVTTKAIKLDSLASSLELAQSVVLKIDVEGAEMAVLHGAIGLIDRVRMVMVEVHSGSLQQEVIRFLSAHGFSASLISAGGLFPAHVVGTRRSLKKAWSD